MLRNDYLGSAVECVKQVIEASVPKEHLEQLAKQGFKDNRFAHFFEEDEVLCVVTKIHSRELPVHHSHDYALFKYTFHSDGKDLSVPVILLIDDEKKIATQEMLEKDEKLYRCATAVYIGSDTQRISFASSINQNDTEVWMKKMHTNASSSILRNGDYFSDNCGEIIEEILTQTRYAQDNTNYIYPPHFNVGTLDASGNYTSINRDAFIETCLKTGALEAGYAPEDTYIGLLEIINADKSMG